MRGRVISQLFIEAMRFHTNDCLERVEEVEQGTMNIQYLKEIKMEREIITEDVVEAFYSPFVFASSSTININERVRIEL